MCKTSPINLLEMGRWSKASHSHLTNLAEVKTKSYKATLVDTSNSEDLYYTHHASIIETRSDGEHLHSQESLYFGFEEDEVSGWNNEDKLSTEGSEVDEAEEVDI